MSLRPGGAPPVDPAVFDIHFDISRMPEAFKKYWLHGAGAAKIRWGQGGDFDRCCTAINAKITKHGRKPLPDRENKGLCANLHREATGATPGHAPGESHHALDPTARMAELIAEFNVVHDTEYWGEPEGTLIRAGMHPHGRRRPTRKAPHGGGSHGNNQKQPNPQAVDPEAAKLVDGIREKYNLPPAKDDNKIRDDLPKNQVAAVKSVAGRTMARVRNLAGKIRSGLKSWAAKRKGKLAREDTEFKSVESLERKIADIVVRKKVSPEIAAASISDALRYTVVLPNDGYWAAGTAIGDDLVAAGYRRGKQSAGWDFNRPYVGRNDTFISPDGLEFEVQFHTAESLAAAERNHPLYDLARRDDTPKEAQDELNAAQRAYNVANVTPPNDLPNNH